MKILVMVMSALLSYSLNAQTPNWQLKCEYDFSQTFGSQNYYYDFDPGDEQKGVIINNSDIMKTTTDGGQTWSSNINRPYSSCRSVKYIAPGKLLTTGYKQIYLSLNNGQTHTQINNNYPNQSIYSIDAKGDFILMGADGHYVYYSTDGGLTFNQTRIATNAQPLKNAHILDSSFAYVIAEAGAYFTLNKGQTWTKVSPPISGYYYAFSAKDRFNWLIAFKDSTDDYRLFKTTDGGNNWQDISSLLPKENSLPNSKRVSIFNLFATPDGQVFMAVSNKPALYSSDFCTSSLVYDSVDTSIDLSNSTEHKYKIINNKVYLLVRFSSGGDNPYRIYTTNINLTGVDKSTQIANNLFTVFPNPNEGNFTVKVNDHKPRFFEIYNSLGQLVYEIEHKQIYFQLDLNLQSGMYYVKEKETGIIQKLMIK